MTLSGTYAAVHQRLRARRGSASSHPCSAPGCSRQATRWSWNHEGPSAHSEVSKEKVWGLDLDTYVPMCTSHALMTDRGTLTHCPRGHDRAEAGLTKRGKCLTCHRDSVSRANAMRRKR